jgi:rod shape-determining protein MreC
MPRFLKDQKRALIFAGLLFTQFVLVSLQVPRGTAPSYFERAVFVLVSPLQKAVHAVFGSAASAWERYVDLRRVEGQNETLQDEVFRLRQENMVLRNDLQGFRDARELASRIAPLGEPFLVASVIGADAADIYKSIVIDRGASDGIRPNMAVVDRAGCLVGRVVGPTGPGSAAVQLLTDSNSAVGVRSETSLVQGILSGDGKSGTCWLRYVLATNETLAEGEELLTSGFDKIFPAGLRTGTVLTVEMDGSLFKRVAVRSHLDWSRMGKVAVLTRMPDDGPAGAR